LNFSEFFDNLYLDKDIFITPIYGALKISKKFLFPPAPQVQAGWNCVSVSVQNRFDYYQLSPTRNKNRISIFLYQNFVI